MNKAWSAVLVAVLKYILGPVVAVALGVGYSSQNHEKSVKGYEVLAKALNDQVLARLNHLDQQLSVIESRLDKLEAQPASQPLRIDRIIVPGGRVDPFDIGKAMRLAPRPATVTSKVLTKALPAAKAPAPPRPKPAPSQQLVPSKL
jgi:hypothetical protein